MSKVKIKDVREGKFPSFTVSLFDGQIDIKGCVYKQGKGANGPFEFVGMPQRKAEVNGETRWFSDIYLGKELAAEVLAAYKEEVSNDLPF